MSDPGHQGQEYTTVSFTKQERLRLDEQAKQAGFSSVRRFILYVAGKSMPPRPGQTEPKP